MNLDDARSRLGQRYTVIRSDPFVIDAGLWLALGDLVQVMRDAYTTRQTWENATTANVAAELERLHRRVHRDLIVKLAAAASAAGIDGAPENAPEASPLVSGRSEANRPSPAYRAGAGGSTAPGPHRAGGGE